ncbi:MAG: hypothetical protein N2442_03425 [Spirochaetes bacterium]|nr:hypothetical protein [Spirochaetota bacterium]
MWKKENLFYLGCIWEVLRFIFLFSLVSFLVNPGGRVLYTLYFLWVSAPLLVIPFLFFLSAYQSERIPSLRPILVFGKVLELIPLGILLAFLYLLPSGGMDKAIRWGMAVPIIIGWIDFLFFLFLLFYPHQQEP